MIQEKMIHIKEEYLQDKMIAIKEECRKCRLGYLCDVSERLGIRDEFQEYLVNNLDDTMINSDSNDKNEARWFLQDMKGRLNWLNKHIVLLGSNK